ncbi:acetyltransferase [Alkalibacillus sp. S2W]|uniref:acetyltransferase n=1 Tax=Alkalibacillus sp. S2W TaxID=3386553 RepID=UPI00398CE4E8
MTRNLLIIGGGGHAQVVLDSLYRLNYYDSIGVVEQSHLIGEEVLDSPIVGTDDDLPQLFLDGYNEAFVTIGSHEKRQQLSDDLRTMGYHIPSIVDLTAAVSPYAKVLSGAYVGKQAVINPRSDVEEGVIVNTGAMVEHDCAIGAWSHIAPGAVVCGGVSVGSSTHIGANSVIRENQTIGHHTTIGMGSVVVHAIHSHTVAYGNPCREVTST